MNEPLDTFIRQLAAFACAADCCLVTADCCLLIKSSQMAASPLARLIEHFSLTAIAHGFAYLLASWLAMPAHPFWPCYLPGRLEWEVAQTEILFHFPWPALAKTCKVGVNGSRWWLFIVIFMTALHTNTPRRRWWWLQPAQTLPLVPCLPHPKTQGLASVAQRAIFCLSFDPAFPCCRKHLKTF